MPSGVDFGHTSVGETNLVLPACSDDPGVCLHVFCY